MFTPASRYADLETATYQSLGGSPIRYARRRFLPDPASLAPLGVIAVLPMDRADRVAYRALDDAELSWRLADGNGADDPRELTEQNRLIGPNGLDGQVVRILRVTGAAGVHPFPRSSAGSVSG